MHFSKEMFLELLRTKKQKNQIRLYFHFTLRKIQTKAHYKNNCDFYDLSDVNKYLFLVFFCGTYPEGGYTKMQKRCLFRYKIKGFYSPRPRIEDNVSRLGIVSFDILNIPANVDVASCMLA
jgi:hypothetical protein